MHITWFVVKKIRYINAWKKFRPKVKKSTFNYNLFGKMPLL